MIWLCGRAALNAVLLDTHTWAWSITRDRRLSAMAQAAITDAETVYVSPITFFEIALKVRAGKWPGMAEVPSHMAAYLKQQSGKTAELGPMICLMAGQLDWAHRDPFDRMLAATALHLGVPIVSADAIFDGLVARIW